MARISKLQQEMNEKFERKDMVEEVVDIKAQTAAIDKLQDEIDALIVRISVMEKTLSTSKKSTINKVEVFNGEVESTPEAYSGIKMILEDKLDSMRNAARILPPNLIENGRHTRENIQAICGFAVDEDMMDMVYANLSHED